MNVAKGGNRLQFDDDGILHKQIETMLADLPTPETNRHSQLALEFQTRIGESDTKRFFVD